MEKWVIGVYFLLLFGANFIRKRTGNETADYLLAGRRVTLLPFVATMVSTGYGWIGGVGEMYFHYAEICPVLPTPPLRLIYYFFH